MLVLFSKIQSNPYQYSSALEDKIFGVTHQDVGSFFLTKWFFPEEVVEAIQYHHKLSTEKSDSYLPIAVAMGNNISKALEIGKSTSGLVELLPQWTWDKVGLSESKLRGIVASTKHVFYKQTDNLADRKYENI